MENKNNNHSDGIQSVSKGEIINLIGNFKIRKKVDNSDRDYKGEYTRFFLPIDLPDADFITKDDTKKSSGNKSSTNFLIIFSLFILKTKGEPVYGKEILNEINDILDDSVWKPSHGTLYPLLTKLEKQGLIRAGKETKTRKYYEITETGIEFLDSQQDAFKMVLRSSSKFFDNVYKKLYKDMDKSKK